MRVRVAVPEWMVRVEYPLEFVERAGAHCVWLCSFGLGLGWSVIEGGNVRLDCCGSKKKT